MATQQNTETATETAHPADCTCDRCIAEEEIFWEKDAKLFSLPTTDDVRAYRHR